MDHASPAPPTRPGNGTGVAGDLVTRYPPRDDTISEAVPAGRSGGDVVVPPQGAVAATVASRTPAQVLLAMTLGVAQTQALRAAAELRLADLLASGPRNSAQLAGDTGAAPDELLRLLRVLTHLGVVEEVAPETFATTEVGDLLRSDAPQSLRNYAILMGQECFASTWPGLTRSIRTGDNSFHRLHGHGVYEHFRANPEVGTVMYQAMTEVSRQEGVAVREAYRLEPGCCVVDVGGGRGTLLATLLQAYPEARGILFDLPHVVSEAGPVLASHGLADRCQVVGGDFTVDIPARGDLYVLKRILMDTNDEDAVALLSRIRTLTPEHGRLLVAEPDVRTLYGKGLDLFVLQVFTSKLRTEAELATLFDRTGFRLARTVDTDSAIRLFEAAPA